jgi:hypothetical protein
VAGVTEAGTRVPTTLRWAIALLLAEAVAVVAVIGYAALAGNVVISRDAPVLGFAAIMVAVLALLGWALARLHSWARTPATVMELMLLPLGWFMVRGGLAWLGVPLLAIGLVGAGLLIAPATRAALGVK